VIATIAVKEAAWRFGPLTGHDAAADKEIDLAVAIEVGGGTGRAAFPVGGKHAGGRRLETAMAVAQVEAVVEVGIARS